VSILFVFFLEQWFKPFLLSEYSPFLTAALSIAIPIRSGLRSSFVVEDGSFTHPSLAQVFDEVDPLPIYDAVDTTGPSHARKALVNLDFSTRRNLRHMTYWIEHIGRIINVGPQIFFGL
jgi:hypothetical protein